VPQSRIYWHGVSLELPDDVQVTFASVSRTTSVHSFRLTTFSEDRREDPDCELVITAQRINLNIGLQEWADGMIDVTVGSRTLASLNGTPAITASSADNQFENRLWFVVHHFLGYRVRASNKPNAGRKHDFARIIDSLRFADI
jgi:hypothetical protein